MFLYIFRNRFLHRHPARLLLQVRPYLPFRLEGQELLPGEFQAGDRGVVLAHAHEAFGVGARSGEVVPHRLHQGDLSGLRELEPVDDALIDHLLGGEHEEHVRISYDVLRVLVVRQLVGVLDDGVHGPVLLPDLLVAESHRTVYAGARGRIDHLRGLAVLVEDQYAPFPPVTEQLLLYDGEYHPHDQVAQEPVLLDLRELEHDELLFREIGPRVLADVLVPLSGHELPAVQPEGLQGEVRAGDVPPFKDLLVVIRDIPVESLEIMPGPHVLVVVLYEPGQRDLLLRLVLCEHVPPVLLHDSREHLQGIVVQFLPLQVERVDTQRRPPVVVHVQGDVRVETAELAETFSELHHHNRIVLLDELLCEVQGEGGLSASGPRDDHPVACVDPLLPGVPDVLAQGYLVHPVMDVDALGVIPETSALQEKTQRYGQGGQEQVVLRNQVDLSGDAGEVDRRQVPVSGDIVPEAGQVECLPDPLVGLLQLFLRLVKDADREEAAHQRLVLVKYFLLQLVQLLVLRLDGLAHAGVAPVDIDVPGDPLPQPSVPLKEYHLVDDVVVRQVHSQAFQQGMVQLGPCGGERVVPDAGVQMSVRQEGLVAYGEAARPFLSRAELRVSMYVHDCPSVLEKRGVSCREFAYLLPGHGEQLRSVHALYDARCVGYPLEELAEPVQVLLVQALLIGQR